MLPEELQTKWLFWRLLYYAGAGLLFFVIVYFGARYCVFGSFRGLTPADFVAEVQSECVPVVRAMKEYQLDYGRFPAGDIRLTPKYLRQETSSCVYGYFGGDPFFVHYCDNWPSRGTEIKYDFTPSDEGWIISGPLLHGRIPLPPVTLSPQPTATAH